MRKSLEPLRPPRRRKKKDKPVFLSEKIEIPSVRDAEQRPKKILLRVDARTQVLVSPKTIPPNMRKFFPRRRYKVERKIELGRA